MDKKLLTLVLLLGIGMPLMGQDKSYKGFFLRFLPGYGSGEHVYSSNENTFTHQGYGSIFHFQIGTGLTTKFQIYASINGFLMRNFTLDYNNSKSTISADYNISDVGAGVSYYFPDNVYIALGAYSSMAIIRTDTTSSEINGGWGASIMLGKEWLVSPTWGIGVATVYYRGSLPDITYAISQSYYGVLFSATYR